MLKDQIKEQLSNVLQRFHLKLINPCVINLQEYTYNETLDIEIADINSGSSLRAL